MKFQADAMKITGPNKSDGSYKVEFWTGEYEKENVAELLKLPSMIMLEVTVKTKNG